MAKRASGPATDPKVKAQVAATDNRQDDWIADAVKAVNAYARGRVLSVIEADVDLEDVPDPWPWPADLETGCVMLAARIVRRRNSPDGVAAMTDAGVAYVARTDPDVAMLLRLGPYSHPVVG